MIGQRRALRAFSLALSRADLLLLAPIIAYKNTYCALILLLARRNAPRLCILSLLPVQKYLLCWYCMRLLSGSPLHLTKTIPRP